MLQRVLEPVTSRLHSGMKWRMILVVSGTTVMLDAISG